MSAFETWRISRSKGLCSACGSEFSPSQGLFSALREQGEDFARHDFCSPCWGGQHEAEFFCHWKTRRPQPEQRQVLDTELMVEFFERLEGAEGENKKVFRFVVALYLMRRKELKLLGAERPDGREMLAFEQRRSGRKTLVETPDLSEEQLQEAAAQLNGLLNADL
jgi:hypothetical protein